MPTMVVTERDPLDETARIATTLLGQSFLSLTRIGGGRNSQVYRIDLGNGHAVVLKRYFQTPRDSRDRRLTEVGALRFLHEHGVTGVPRVLGSSPDYPVLILEYLEGVTVSPSQATTGDLDCLAQFLITLQRLSREPAATALPPASEAVFTLPELLGTIALRLDRLRQVERMTPLQQELARFLDEEFQPALSRVSAWAEKQLRPAGGWTCPLPVVARTLSPSDFGFHNCLRRSDGNLVFVDFEHFGWDDPAKTISDFLLHPGMALSVEQRGWFLQGLLAGMGRDHALLERMRVTYVLYGLKWVMILLNEFVPEHLARRVFADPSLRTDDVHRAQLDKARDMLAWSLRAQIAFPYNDWIGG